MEALPFYILSFVAIATSIVVVTSRRPTYAVLALAMAMLALSALFVLLKAYFVAIIQILIYAGAILVLFLFVIMLLGVGEEELTMDRERENSAKIKMRRSINIFLLVVFLSELALIILAIQNTQFPKENFAGTVEAIGTALFTQYLLPFELVSGILLIGILGVVSLTQKELGKRT